jgi:hypothetical protein
VHFKLGDLTITTTTGDAITGSASATSKDTLSGTFAASDTTAEFTQFSGIETYNFTFKDGVAIVAEANDGVGDGDNKVETITMSGGNAQSTYSNATNAGAIDGTALTLFDASGLGGEISLNVDGSRMDNLTIKGSTASAKDAVVYSAVNGLTAITGKAVTEGVETVTLLTATAASTIDTSAMVGVTKIAVENDQNVTLTNLKAGVELQLGASATAGVEDYTGTLTVKLADTESQNLTLLANNAGEAVLFDMANVETLNIKMGTDSGDTDLNLTNFDMDTAGQTNAVVVTGALNLDIVALSGEPDCRSADAAQRYP